MQTHYVTNVKRDKFLSNNWKDLSQLKYLFTDERCHVDQIQKIAISFYVKTYVKTNSKYFSQFRVDHSKL